MKTIHKFPIPCNSDVEIEAPEQSKLLHVGLGLAEANRLHPTSVCLWFLVDTALPKQTCHFQVRSTGEDCSDVGKHLGTVVVNGGEFVWHVFEKRNS